MSLRTRKAAQLLLIIGLMTVGLSPLIVAAGEGYVGDKGVSFGPRASFFKPKDADDGVWSGGAQLRFFLSKALAFEGALDYRREKFGRTRVHVYPVQASLLAYLVPRKPVSVYLLGGPGWYFTRIDLPSPFEDDTDERFGLHAGGGLEIHLNDYWSLDGNYRYVWIEKFSAKDANLLDKDFSDNGNQATVGLNYHF